MLLKIIASLSALIDADSKISPYFSINFLSYRSAFYLANSFISASVFYYFSNASKPFIISFANCSFSSFIFWRFNIEFSYLSLVLSAASSMCFREAAVFSSFASYFFTFYSTIFRLSSKLLYYSFRNFSSSFSRLRSGWSKSLYNLSLSFCLYRLCLYQTLSIAPKSGWKGMFLAPKFGGKAMGIAQSPFNINIKIMYFANEMICISREAERGMGVATQ